ncbi:MAG: hypothetical protein COA75_11745 [Cellvibrionales bacterium]|nr:MAG: hypothetical protein COA75_11745 [Cellvibrionales bacterium]
MILKESEENLALTLDCIGDAVIATDLEGLVTRMNSVAEELTGWAVSEAIGRSVRDVFPIVDAETLEPVANPVHQALATGKVVTLSNHTTLLAKNAEEYQVADSAVPYAMAIPLLVRFWCFMMLRNNIKYGGNYLIIKSV